MHTTQWWDILHGNKYTSNWNIPTTNECRFNEITASNIKNSKKKKKYLEIRRAQQPQRPLFTCTIQKPTVEYLNQSPNLLMFTTRYTQYSHQPNAENKNNNFSEFQRTTIFVQGFCVYVSFIFNSPKIIWLTIKIYICMI